ncbi:MAG: hypothetical protein J6B77_05990 [Clostridia bacterium]|nr:hypothetical protein [Clostridia bacterium]
MLNFLEKFRPAKVEEKPSALAKIGKGVLIGVGVVAGIAAVFTVVEVVLVKFFKKCITITVQCTDLSAYDEDEEIIDEDECEDVCDEAEEEVVSE